MAQTLAAPIHLFDYLADEDASERRHEYVGGSMHAMTGGTMRHNRIALNAAAALMQGLSGRPCQVFINDMKLHVQSADSVYYPDVFVYCGSPLAGGRKVVQDATLIIEVLSESTAEIDRREKLLAYQKLPGLQAYWIVSQEERRIEVHSRAADGRWQAMAYGSGETLPAVAILGGNDALPLDTPLDTLYTGTDITP